MAKPNPPPAADKPLPETGRPGTSGTQMLTSNRRAASSAFQKAYRAEQSHLARKQATAARQGLKEAKGHFSLSRQEFWLGVKKVGGGFRAIPAVLMERRLESMKKRDTKHMEIAMQKKKLWEERAAAAEAAGGDKTEPTATV